jgi:chromosome segregation ATPase
MFDWPVKSEDIDLMIKKLEKKLSEKKLELDNKSLLIQELTKSIENFAKEVRDLKLKIEFMEEETKKLEENLEKSKLKKEFIEKELIDLKDAIHSKQEELILYNRKNSYLNEILAEKEYNQEKVSLKRSEIILKDIKQVLSYQGFFSKKEFEEKFEIKI